VNRDDANPKHSGRQQRTFEGLHSRSSPVAAAVVAAYAYSRGRG
jgi:hypothetical protein